MHAPRVDRVLETCLYAQDVGAAAAFYQQVVGLEPIGRAEGRHVFFRVGAAMLLLFQPDRTSEATDVPAHGAAGPGHVAFAIGRGEVGWWRDRLTGHGVPIEREIEWPRGGTSLYVRDPAGNSVEFATPGLWPLES